MLHQNKGKTIHPYMDSFNHIFFISQYACKIGQKPFYKEFQL